MTIGRDMTYEEPETLVCLKKRNNRDSDTENSYTIHIAIHIATHKAYKI